MKTSRRMSSKMRIRRKEERKKCRGRNGTTNGRGKIKNHDVIMWKPRSVARLLHSPVEVAREIP